MRCDNTNLYDRLKDRGYNEEKITENIECEIFGELAAEVSESYKPEITVELQSAQVEDMETNIGVIVSKIKELMA